MKSNCRIFSIISLSAASVLVLSDCSSPLRKLASSGEIDSKEYSKLWGQSGEKFSPEIGLPDFSYAGYEAGEKHIPTFPVTSNLKKDFGAKGDGKTDDSEAFIQAALKAPPGAILIPTGTYVITQEVDIHRSGIVFRGEGPGKTVLLFPKSRTDVYGNVKDSQGYSQWSFGPGFLIFGGDTDQQDPIDATTLLSTVIGTAKRGETHLQVSQNFSFQPGEWIRLVESDPPQGDPNAGSLLKRMMGDLLEPGTDLIDRPHPVRFLSRIKSLEDGELILERPLPVDVDPIWRPEIHRFKPETEQVGIEDLSFRFPLVRYAGHFNEAGYNALSFHGTSQCWARNLEIINADFAIELEKTNFCTVENVIMSSSFPRANEDDWYGHNGIYVGYGNENLIRNFNIKEKFVHDLAYEWFSLHTVYMEGKGMDMNFDFHRESPYESLATDIDLGIGSRPFESGGSGDRGPHTAAYATFWNIRSKIPLKDPNTENIADLANCYALKMPPHCTDFGPLINFAGVNLGEQTLSSEQTYLHWNEEDFNPATLSPQNLYEAQKERRLKQ